MAGKRGPSQDIGKEDSSISQQPPKKRKREYTEADAKLADTLERLGSEIQKDRIKAAEEIVNLFKAPNSTTSSEKILVRLIRGLCSSRKSSRPGFFVALTEILRVSKDEPRILEKLNPAEVLLSVLEKIKKETKIEGSASSQEKRDYFLGRLTGYSATVQSGVLFHEELDTSILTSVLQEVYEVGLKTPQLTEQCGKVYFDVVALAVEQGDKGPIENVLQFLAEKNLLKTPEGVAIWLQVSNSTLDIRYPKHVWHHKNPLAAKELSTLAKVLRDDNANSGSEDLPKGKFFSGIRRDTPHFAWHTILTTLFKTDTSTESSSLKNFERFWIEAVDNIYFAPTASVERKALGLRIFSIVVSVGPVWACVKALSPKLTNCLINQRRKDDRFLHHAATSVLDDLKSRAASEKTLASCILTSMALKDEKPDVDRFNKSKPYLNQMLEAADGVVAQSMIWHYSCMLFKPSVEDQQEASKWRRMIADHLISSIRLRKRQTSEQSREFIALGRTILRAFLRCCCIRSEYERKPETPACDPPVSNPCREMFKSRLLSCLKEVLNTQTGEAVDLVHSIVQDVFGLPSQDLVFVKGNQAVEKAMTLGHEVLRNLQDVELVKGKKKATHQEAFKLLFSIVILQIGCGEADAISMLTELIQSYRTVNEQHVSQPAGYDNVIELVLGFCSKPSALYRSLAEQVFVTFAPELSTEGMKSMIHILGQEENQGGQSELFDQHDDDELYLNGATDVDGTLTSEVDPVDSDVEIVDAAADGESSSSESKSTASSDADEKEEVNDADEALNDSLALILQTRKSKFLPVANGHGEEEETSSSDESMDDEQMEALGIDNQLSVIFAQRMTQTKSGKKASDKKREQKDAKQNVLNFKNRVLDLLAIYVKQQHESPIALGLIHPLVQLIGRTRSAQVAKKASELLDAYFKSAKTKGMPLSASAENVLAILAQVHEEVLVFPSKLHASACSRGSLFLARLLILQKEEGVMGKLIDIYGATHKERFETVSKVPASFWTDFVNWSVSMGSEK